MLAAWAEAGLGEDGRRVGGGGAMSVGLDAHSTGENSVLTVSPAPQDRSIPEVTQAKHVPGVGHMERSQQMLENGH